VACTAVTFIYPPLPQTPLGLRVHACVSSMARAPVSGNPQLVEHRNPDTSIETWPATIGMIAK
jgi:hypothetical protein